MNQHFEDRLEFLEACVAGDQARMLHLADASESLRILNDRMEEVHRHNVTPESSTTERLEALVRSMSESYTALQCESEKLRQELATKRLAAIQKCSTHCLDAARDKYFNHLVGSTSEYQGGYHAVHSLSNTLDQRLEALQALRRDVTCVISDYQLQQQDVKARTETLSETTRAEMEKHESALADVERQLREVEELVREKQQCADKLSCLIAQAKQSPAELENKLRELESIIAGLDLRVLTAQGAIASREDEKKTLAQKILSARDQCIRMNETMMLLKSAVINLYRDYKFIETTRKRISKNRDKEGVFKEAHNTIKVAMFTTHASGGSHLHNGGNSSTAVTSTAPSVMHWKLTEAEIEQRLDDHRVRTVFHAFQEMVVAWDMMTAETRHSLITTDEIVENALVLYAIARHTMHRLNVRLTEQRAKIDSGHTPRITQKQQPVAATEAPTGMPSGARRGSLVSETPQRRQSFAYMLRNTPPSTILAHASSSPDNKSSREPVREGTQSLSPMIPRAALQELMTNTKRVVGMSRSCTRSKSATVTRSPSVVICQW